MDMPDNSGSDIAVIAGVASGIIALLLTISVGICICIIVRRGENKNKNESVRDQNDVNMQSARESERNYGRVSSVSASEHYDDPRLLAINEYGVVKSSNLPQTQYDSPEFLQDKGRGTEYDSSAL